MSTPTNDNEPAIESPKSDKNAEQAPDQVAEFHRLRNMYVEEMRPFDESIRRSQFLTGTDLATVINC